MDLGQPQEELTHVIEDHVLSNSSVVIAGIRVGYLPAPDAALGVLASDPDSFD